MVLQSQFISSVRQPALIMQNKASVLLLVTHSIGYKTLLDFTLIVLGSNDTDSVSRFKHYFTIIWKYFWISFYSLLSA